MWLDRFQRVFLFGLCRCRCRVVTTSPRSLVWSSGLDTGASGTTCSTACTDTGEDEEENLCMSGPKAKSYDGVLPIEVESVFK